MGRRPEIAWYTFSFCKYSFVNRWANKYVGEMKAKVLPHSSITKPSGHILEAKVCPELHAELTKGGSGAELGPHSLEVLAGGCFARQKHDTRSFQWCLSCTLTAQNPGSSGDLDLHHFSHWWFKHWLCWEYIQITSFVFFSLHLCLYFSYNSNNPLQVFWMRQSVVPWMAMNSDWFQLNDLCLQWFKIKKKQEKNLHKNGKISALFLENTGDWSSSELGAFPPWSGGHSNLLGSSGVPHCHSAPPPSCFSPAQLCAEPGTGSYKADTSLFKQMRPSVLAAWGRWNLSSSAGEKTDYATLSTVFFTLLFLISIVNQMNKWPLSCADGPGKYKYPILCGKRGLLVLHPSLSGKVYFLLARQQLCWGPNLAFFYRSLKPLGFYSRWERRVMP